MPTVVRPLGTPWPMHSPADAGLDVPVVVGGIVPDSDVKTLQLLGN